MTAESLNLITKTGLIKIKPRRYEDNRGFFCETYSLQKYLDFGIGDEFVQENHSVSRHVGTIRGLHFQTPPHAQAKLVRCGRGAIFDVAVDIRQGSPTYGSWEGFELTAENGHQLYVPVGFAHGFATLLPDSEIVYKCSEYYAPVAERSILWSDPDIEISWPRFEVPILSEKDATAPMLADFESPFVYGENS